MKVDEDILAYNYFLKLKNLDRKDFDKIFYIEKI